MAIFDNSYFSQLPQHYAEVSATSVPNPVLQYLNHDLVQTLGLASELHDERQAALYLSGNELLPGAQPLAQAYAGHQFGHFSPQLGDGRAVLLGEALTDDGQRFDIQLKGSGPTPFSRRGDGRATLSSVLRENLMCEAMFALGIPTTRALAVVTTGETVYRDPPEPGAVFTRIASSHIRVGTFEYFAARQEQDRVRELADYTIQRHYPHAADADNPYLALLAAVCDAQAQLIAQWMAIGFIHGVMNTDNMTISGETIDYGPCAFMPVYDPDTVFSSIDHGGRYAYKNQPAIAQWNLARLAEALLPLIDTNDPAAIQLAMPIINGFLDSYRTAWLSRFGAKLGLATTTVGDAALIEDFLALLHNEQRDFTVSFRALSSLIVDDTQAPITVSTAMGNWLQRWRTRLAAEPTTATHNNEHLSQYLDTQNPRYIPRNHWVDQALRAAVAGDTTRYDQLVTLLASPFEDQHVTADFPDDAPEDFGQFVTYCGT